MRLVFVNEAYHPLVEASLPRPKQPLLGCRLEVDDVESGYESRVKVGELVLVTGVDCTDDAASLRKHFACQLAVQRTMSAIAPAP